MRQHISRFGTRPTYAATKRSARSAARVEAVEPRILLATFTVTGTNDAGPGSLRECILAANANGGADTIAFSIGTGPQTIRPATALPAVEGATTIDGRTQPGWAGTPLIQIDGPAAYNEMIGLDVRGVRSQLLDLSVTRFYTGIRVTGDRTAVAGCYAGLDPSGAVGANGTGIELSANECTIGATPDLSDGNVISGNDQFAGTFGFAGSGILIMGHANTLTGNRIGTNPAGTAKMPNFRGVEIWGDANHIGTPEASARGERNVISGNRFENLQLEQADGTFIHGNYIGTDATGYNGLGGNGLQVHGSADVTIGGTEPGAGNLISSNGAERLRGVTQGAVMIDGEASARAVVQGNFIGVRADGLFSSGNGGHGVYVRGAPDVVIGGSSAAARNVIGYTLGDLIRVEGPTARHPIIQGNYVGVNAAGDASQVHGGDIGIDILGAPDAVIGGGQPGARNVVSRCRIGISLGGFYDDAANISYGIRGARVQGNYIGTNADGTATYNSANFTFGNRDGLWVGGVDMLVGGTGPGDGNVISNNYWDGVHMGGRGVTLVGNRIGTTPDGTAALPNLEDGVGYGGGGPEQGDVPLSVLGGTAPAAANVISGNRRDGVQIRLEGLVVGNLIGVAADAVTPLGNGRDGVRVELDSIPGGRPIIGGVGAGEGNVIAYNTRAGVQIGDTFYQDIAPPDAAVLGNRIFANGAIGIDSGNAGVTPNDMPETSATPQNRPVITSAIWGGGPGETGTHVVGTLDSEAFTHFRVEFFSNREVDPSGYGEGATFIGAVDVDTNAAGHVDFDAALPVTLTQDDYVTATATKVLLLPGPGPRAVRTSEFSAAVQAAAAPSVPPRVLYVGVSGEGWSPDFGNGLRGAYQVPDGAEQLGVLPWVNNNKIIIRFNRDVEIGSSNLTVRSIIDGRLYDNGRFDYDPVKHVATWTLEGPPLADRVRLDLPSGELGVRAGGPGGAGTQFDGEWDNGRDAYPSGDGSAGGDFHFRLNLLPGDATRDGRVDSLDLAYVKQRLNRTARNPGTGAVTYTPFADLNADGRVNSLDLSAIKVWLNHSLPGGPPPASLTSPAPAPASVTRDWFVDVSILPV